MKRFAFLGFGIAILMAPVQVQAQQCVTFQGPPNPEAEVRYFLSHPSVVVCPVPGDPLRHYDQEQQLLHWGFVEGSAFGRAVHSTPHSTPAPVREAPVTDTANSSAGQSQPNHE
jgi:hypothetical protein